MNGIPKFQIGDEVVVLREPTLVPGVVQECVVNSSSERYDVDILYTIGGISRGESLHAVPENLLLKPPPREETIWQLIPRSDRRIHAMSQYDREDWVARIGEKAYMAYLEPKGALKDELRYGDLVFFVTTIAGRGIVYQWLPTKELLPFESTLTGKENWDERLWWDEQFRDWWLWLYSGEKITVYRDTPGVPTISIQKQSIGIWGALDVHGINVHPSTTLYYAGSLATGIPKSASPPTKKFASAEDAINWVESLRGIVDIA
jgi:hypothetical protein